MSVHGDVPDFAKVRWIDDSQLRRAVAHDDVPAVLRHAPAFALVAKAAGEREIIPTPAKAHAVLPCKTENFVLPRHDSFAEILRWKGHAAQNFPVLQPDLADVGLPLTPGTLVKRAVLIEKPFEIGSASCRERVCQYGKISV